MRFAECAGDPSATPRSRGSCNGKGNLSLRLPAASNNTALQGGIIITNGLWRTAVNELTNITGNGPITMSSREIAELTGKQHKHVMRDIKAMLEQLDEPEEGYAQTWTNPQNGQTYPEYRLDRDLTETLLLGYSAPLRRKVLARLRELEGFVANPATLLNDPAAMRGLLLSYTEKVIELEHQVEEMLPTVEAYEQIAGTNGSMNRTEAAKHLGIPPHVLCKWMRTNGWTYRRPGAKDDIAYQSKIIAGYLEHKVTSGPRSDGTEWIGTQVRVTPKGLTVLAKAFPPSARAA